jgi:hypothetical protein
MRTSDALRILQRLADGADPETGGALPADGPYPSAQIVRAPMVVVRAVERQQKRERRNRALPENAGNAWTEEEERQVCRKFDGGVAIGELAKRRGRTEGSIQSRLERLGRIQPTGTTMRQT